MKLPVVGQTANGSFRHISDELDCKCFVCCQPKADPTKYASVGGRTTTVRWTQAQMVSLWVILLRLSSAQFRHPFAMKSRHLGRISRARASG